jgi:hypothetical protein
MRRLEDAMTELPHAAIKRADARGRRFLAMERPPVAFGKRPVAKKGLRTPCKETEKP